MAEQTAPWSLKEMQRSHAALDGFLTQEVLAALADGLRDVDGSETGRTGVQAVLDRRGIDLAPGISINFPFGPPPIGPPTLPPIVLGTPQPFRRCLTICHQIGPVDPRDPDPTRVSVCYVLCIP
jgi:hypothetical protein